MKHKSWWRIFTHPRFNINPKKMVVGRVTLSYWVSVTFQGRTFEPQVDFKQILMRLLFTDDMRCLHPAVGVFFGEYLAACLAHRIWPCPSTQQGLVVLGLPLWLSGHCWGVCTVEVKQPVFSVGRFDLKPPLFWTPWCAHTRTKTYALV